MDRKWKRCTERDLGATIFLFCFFSFLITFTFTMNFLLHLRLHWISILHPPLSVTIYCAYQIIYVIFLSLIFSIPILVFDVMANDNTDALDRFPVGVSVALDFLWFQR